MQFPDYFSYKPAPMMEFDGSTVVIKCAQTPLLTLGWRLLKTFIRDKLILSRKVATPSKNGANLSRLLGKEEVSEIIANQVMVMFLCYVNITTIIVLFNFKKYVRNLPKYLK